MHNELRAPCWLAVAAAGCGVAAALMGRPAAAAIDFTEIARFDISSTATNLANLQPQDVGSNPSALAWKAGKLYVAGFNSSGSSQHVRIVEVLGATTTGIVAAPTFGNAFSPLLAPNQRGFSGLALSADGTRLAAAYDDGQNGDNASLQGLQLFDASNNSLVWDKTLRGGSGVDFDPGFPGGDPALGCGVAWAPSFGSGRRALQNAVDGADIWTSTLGMDCNPNGPLPPFVTMNTRDIAFDPATGDMYARVSNEVTFARRTGDNLINELFELGGRGLLVNETDAPGVINQHLAFVGDVFDGQTELDLIVYNKRDTAAAGQALADVVKGVDAHTGAGQTLNFSFLEDFAPATGAAWYDFDFDPASQTLAILDSSNRNVHIFLVGPANPDFDIDDDVDGIDFLTWQRNLGSVAGTLATGDANGDELVDDRDLLIWKALYGTTAASTAAGGAVPEPTGGVLAMLGAALAVGATRRFSRA